MEVYVSDGSPCFSIVGFDVDALLESLEGLIMTLKEDEFSTCDVPVVALLGIEGGHALDALEGLFVASVLVVVFDECDVEVIYIRIFLEALFEELHHACGVGECCTGLDADFEELGSEGGVLKAFSEIGHDAWVVVGGVGAESGKDGNFDKVIWIGEEDVAACIGEDVSVFGLSVHVEEAVCVGIGLFPVVVFAGVEEVLAMWEEGLCHSVAEFGLCLLALGMTGSKVKLFHTVALESGMVEFVDVVEEAEGVGFGVEVDFPVFSADELVEGIELVTVELWVSGCFRVLTHGIKKHLPRLHEVFFLHAGAVGFDDAASLVGFVGLFRSLHCWDEEREECQKYGDQLNHFT